MQRIKCHAYDRDGAVCTFSQDLKIYTCLHIYIYIIFAVIPYAFQIILVPTQYTLR